MILYLFLSSILRLKCSEFIYFRWRYQTIPPDARAFIEGKCVPHKHYVIGETNRQGCKSRLSIGRDDSAKLTIFCHFSSWEGG